jgi:isopentenyl-diphosphate delta-isomerase
MGIDCELEKAFSFIYRAELDHNLIEHELDHVFIGYTSEIPQPNPDEVGDWEAIPFYDLERDVNQNPENYTEWFKLIYNKVNIYACINQEFVKN